MLFLLPSKITLKCLTFFSHLLWCILHVFANWQTLKSRQWSIAETESNYVFLCLRSSAAEVHPIVHCSKRGAWSLCRKPLCRKSLCRQSLRQKPKFDRKISGWSLHWNSLTLTTTKVKNYLWRFSPIRLG